MKKLTRKEFLLALFSPFLLRLKKLRQKRKLKAAWTLERCSNLHAFHSIEAEQLINQFAAEICSVQPMTGPVASIFTLGPNSLKPRVRRVPIHLQKDCIEFEVV